MWKTIETVATKVFTVLIGLMMLALVAWMLLFVTGIVQGPIGFGC